MDAQPTIGIWVDDKLNREPHAIFLQKFLTERTLRKAETDSGAYVLNIDAEWGFGKTFFLERFAKQLRLTGHTVVEVNAWKDDYTDDPFVAVLAAIDEAISPHLISDKQIESIWNKTKKIAAPIAIKAAVGAGKTFFKKVVGSEIKDIVDDTIQEEAMKTSALNAVDAAINSLEKITDDFTEKLILDFNEQNKAINDFRQNLEKAVLMLRDQVTLPLFIMIDELDRCRPSYAISLLERVKHLFDASNICFVFATNDKQLQHAVAGAYGPSFDGYRYLKRFFERTYTLPLPDPSQYSFALTDSLELTKTYSPFLKPDQFIAECCIEYKFDLREIKQLADLLETTLTVWAEGQKVDLITFIVLSEQFIRTGICDISTAESRIPEKFQINTGGYSENGKPAFLNIKQVFNQIASTAENLEKAIALYNQQGVASSVKRYVMSVFRSELQYGDSNRQSIQFQIPILIKSAGNLIK